MPNTIRLHREKAGLTRPALAEKVGTSLSQIVKLERGERKLTQEWMERIGAALEVQPSSLMESQSGIPVIGQVTATGEVILRDPDLPQLVSRDRQLGPVQSCVEVADDGFGPLIPAGSMIYLTSIEIQNPAAYHGAPCAAWTAEGKILIGRLIHGATAGQVGLLLPNGRIIQNLEAETLSPISAILPASGQIGSYPVPWDEI